MTGDASSDLLLTIPRKRMKLSATHAASGTRYNLVRTGDLYTWAWDPDLVHASEFR